LPEPPLRTIADANGAESVTFVSVRLPVIVTVRSPAASATIEVMCSQHGGLTLIGFVEDFGDAVGDAEGGPGLAGAAFAGVIVGDIVGDATELGVGDGDGLALGCGVADGAALPAKGVDDAIGVVVAEVDGEDLGEALVDVVGDGRGDGFNVGRGVTCGGRLGVEDAPEELENAVGDGLEVDDVFPP
jgi:hypothetical protein